MVEIPDLKVSRKIKSIQSFKESVKTISAGDRAGICVQSIESESIERTLISSKPLSSISTLLLKAKRVKYYKNELRSKSKIHISVLNESVQCKQILIVKPTEFGFEYLDKVEDGEEEFHLIVELEKAINILPDAIVIGSKLDSHPSLQQCRIAFYGNSMIFNEKSKLVYKVKQKFSLIDRIILSENRIICKGLGSTDSYIKQGKESISKFIGMKISIYKTGNDDEIVATGNIDSLFGSSGKFNVTLNSIKTQTLFTENNHQQLYLKLSYGKVLNGKKDEKFIEIN